MLEGLFGENVGAAPGGHECGKGGGTRRVRAILRRSGDGGQVEVFVVNRIREADSRDVAAPVLPWRVEGRCQLWDSPYDLSYNGRRAYIREKSMKTERHEEENG